MQAASWRLRVEEPVAEVTEGESSEESEGDFEAGEVEHEGAGGVAMKPIPEVVESQEKSFQLEKGKAILAEETVFPIDTRVICLPLRSANKRAGTVLDSRQNVSGTVDYYVRYTDYDKRFDQWLGSTRVEKLSQDNLSPLKSSSITPISPAEVSSGGAGTSGTPMERVTRSRRRSDVSQSTEELTAIEQILEKEHEERTKIKNIQAVWLGKYEIDAWYRSPYPDKYHQDRLYICEFCLKCFKKKKTLDKHRMKCLLKNPPGIEIYQTTASIKDDQGIENVHHLSVYEVDGSKEKLYCQLLCLLGGLFIDHKILYYEVDDFLFYILTENDASGNHLVGYFSKEKDSADLNISCIVALPPHQGKRYGRFLIAFAYELSKQEGKVGTPERPLSDLGKKRFESYWKQVLLETMRDHHIESIEDLTKWTSIRSADVISTLQPLELTKYWKKEHILNLDKRIFDQQLKKLIPLPDWLKIEPNKFNWPSVPPTSPRKACTSQHPPGTHQLRRSSPQQPRSTSQQLRSTSQQPRSTNRKPRSIRRQSTSTPQQSRSIITPQSRHTRHQPRNIFQQPGGLHQQPGGLHQQPGGLHQQPGGLHQQPGGLHQQPGGLHQQPGGLHQQPGGLHQQPGGLHQQPGGLHQQRGSNPQQPPSSIQQPRSTTQKPRVVRRLEERWH